MVAVRGHTLKKIPGGSSDTTVERGEYRMKMSIPMLAAGLSLVACPAVCDEVADFYKDKTITITSAGGAGGGYGVYALLVAKYLGRFIPGKPNILVSYNPGGGGVVAADYAYNVGPKDGTAILA